MTQAKELQLRYEAKKKDLEHRIAQARADASSEKNDQAEDLRKHLEELEGAVQDSWSKMSESAAKKVNDLLDHFDSKKPS